jgi:hypothetical protein
MPSATRELLLPRYSRLCSFVSAQNLIKRLEIILNSYADVTLVSMLGRTLEDGARLHACLVEGQVVILETTRKLEEATNSGFGSESWWK